MINAVRASYQANGILPLYWCFINEADQINIIQP